MLCLNNEPDVVRMRRCLKKSRVGNYEIYLVVEAMTQVISKLLKIVPILGRFISIFLYIPVLL